MPKVTTLCVVPQGGKILLGMKKRGFGEGWWNGFGGKLQPEETLVEGAIRECQEEAGITPTQIEERGVLTFHFTTNPEVLEVHVFLVDAFAGQPAESEEMKPQWFAVDNIPYDKMWADDPHWLPLILAGKHVQGTFWFGDTKTLLRYTIKELTLTYV